MKKIIILLFLIINLQANKIDISLVSFADFVSKHNDINIVIDEEIDIKISLLVPDNISNNDLLTMFKNTVNKNNLNLKKFGKTYYLTKKTNFSKTSHLYNLKYNSYKDCQSTLNSLGVTYTYLNDLNSLVISSTGHKYKIIEKLLNQIDIKQEQVMLKITIFEFSSSEVKERGVQYTSIYKDASNTIQQALNTIIAPFNTINPTLKSSDFYAALRFLNEDKTINIKQDPFILAKNNKSFKFEAVENIPYLITTTTTQATNTSEQNSIEYKDVGLKINGRALIHKSYITLDIDLIIEDLLPDTDNANMPKTYRRILKSNTDIEYNKVLLLSGLKRIKHTKNDWSIPYLSNIPYLGELFKYKTNSDEELNISIAIEVVNRNE